jgi:hypothetical protein
MSNGDTFCMGLLIRGTVTKSTNAITGLHLCSSHHRIMDPRGTLRMQMPAPQHRMKCTEIVMHRDFHFTSKLSYHNCVCYMDRAGSEVKQKQEYQQESKINAANKSAARRLTKCQHNGQQIVSWLHKATTHARAKGLPPVSVQPKHSSSKDQKGL